MVFASIHTNDLKSTGYLTIELFSSREMNLRAIILYISLASHPKSNKANFSIQTLKHRNMSTELGIARINKANFPKTLKPRNMSNGHL